MSLDRGELIKYWRQNPVDAARDILGADLAPYQRIALKTLWFFPLVIFICNRGGGKTYLISLFCTLRAILYPGERVGFVAPSMRQSAFIFAETEKLYENSSLFRACTVKKPSRSPVEMYVELKHSGRITALPLGDGTKIRGQRFHTLVNDEGAQTPHQILSQVVMPMLATQKNPMAKVRLIERYRQLEKAGIKSDIEELKPINRLVLASTAYYQFNHLWSKIKTYKMWHAYYLANKAQLPLPPTTKDVLNALDKNLLTEDEVLELIPDMHLLLRENLEGLNPKQGRFRKVIIFNYKDAPEGFLDMEIINDAKLSMPEIEFNMEYLSKFPEDSDGYYKSSLINNAVTIDVSIELEGILGRTYIIGIDPARTSDRCAIVILGIKDSKTCYLANVITMHKKSFPAMRKKIREVISAYRNVLLINMDRDGGGLALKDLLMEPYEGQPGIVDRDDKELEFTPGEKILSLPKFHPEWIKDANSGLKSALEQKVLQIPSSTRNNYGDSEEKNKRIDLAFEEIRELKKELESIVVTVNPSGNLHFDTPTKHGRKDRYSALLLAIKGFLDEVVRKKFIKDAPKEEIPDLVDPGWMEDFQGASSDEVLALTEE